jgi:hypothetical protein
VTIKTELEIWLVERRVVNLQTKPDGFSSASALDITLCSPSGKPRWKEVSRIPGNLAVCSVSLTARVGKK